jgi:tetratricopeptide (TPR) repeat protein
VTAAGTIDTDQDEYFVALCSTLPEDVQEAYERYGENFKTGYIALNRGEFHTAVDYLSLALEDNPQGSGYIPLELAAAHLNIGQSATAQQMLEGFVASHIDVLPAYELLCEIYWDQNNPKKAELLLDAVPPDLSDSLAVVRLKGETMFRSGNYQRAAAFYQSFLEAWGWHETIARELAKTHAAMGEAPQAMAIYREILSRCQGCGARSDPAVKHSYAELAFAQGLMTTDILELYLSLSEQLPENASTYFDRISRIYAAMGNAVEAERFRRFSERTAAEKNG